MYLMTPEKLVEAVMYTDLSLTLRMQAGYKHGNEFITSFIEDHIKHHAKILCAEDSDYIQDRAY